MQLEAQQVFMLTSFKAFFLLLNNSRDERKVIKVGYEDDRTAQNKSFQMLVLLQTASRLTSPSAPTQDRRTF